MAYDAANRRAADGSKGASTRKSGTSDCTDSGTNRGVLVLLRHPGTTAQAQHHCYNQRTNCKPWIRFHWNTSI